MSQNHAHRPCRRFSPPRKSSALSSPAAKTKLTTTNLPAFMRKPSATSSRTERWILYGVRLRVPQAELAGQLFGAILLHFSVEMLFLSVRGGHSGACGRGMTAVSSDAPSVSERWRPHRDGRHRCRSGRQCLESFDGRAQVTKPGMNDTRFPPQEQRLWRKQKHAVNYPQCILGPSGALVPCFDVVLQPDQNIPIADGLVMLGRQFGIQSSSYLQQLSQIRRRAFDSIIERIDNDAVAAVANTNRPTSGKFSPSAA